MTLIPSEGDSKGIAVCIVSVVFWTLAVMAVCLRLWARRIQRTALSLNDYAVFVALLITTGLVAGLMPAITIGALGQHMKAVKPSQVVILNKIFLAGQLTWSGANTAVKVSILHLYIKIFRGRAFRYLCIGVISLSLSYCLVVFLEAFLLCRPFAYTWDKTIDGKCADTTKAFLSAGIFNLLIDVVVIILPMPMLWKLQIPLGKKLAITAMFSMGITILVITILRIASIQALGSQDFTYSLADLSCWSALEPTLGIVNACLPVIRPAMQRLFNFEMLTWKTIGRSTRGARTNSHKRQFRSSNLWADDSDTKPFHRLDDDAVPLGDVIGSSQTVSTSQATAKDAANLNTIRVAKDFNIISADRRISS